jgi:DNA-binding transcriptional regulator YdaS (Cro superfamily)
MAELARRLGVTPVYLSQLAARQDGRLPGAMLCVEIEAVTDGAIKRWDLRPCDWWRIWPELASMPGAPDTAMVQRVA